MPPLTEAQEEALAFAYRIASERPKPFYCATGCRFGTCGQRCFDCSGFCYTVYKRVGITVGADTGGMARDANAGRMQWRDRGAGAPGDLILHTTAYATPGQTATRRARGYDGGSNEHVGIVIRYDGDRVITYESAGSQNGVGVYSRRLDFWQDVVHHPAMSSGSAPSKPPPIPQMEDTMLELIVGDQEPHVYITNGMEKRWLRNQQAVDRWLAHLPSPLSYKGVRRMAQYDVDNIPHQKTPTPPDYNGLHV